MAAPLKTAKQLLRKRMKSLVNDISRANKLSQSQHVCQKVLGSSIYQTSTKIAVYLSMADEVQTRPIIERILQDNKLCFIPKYYTDSRCMDMVRLDSLEELDNLPYTKWNIQQPAEDATIREDALNTGGLDFMMVPGLAFTAGGKRMGRGKGYYDTYLTKHETLLKKRPITVALAFNEQILEDVPTDEHDYVIDFVVSEDVDTL